MEILDWSYEKAITGVAGLDSAYELAEGYIDKDGTKYEQIGSLIRWQNTKSGLSGVVTGIGGLATMPIALPANITSVLFVQIRMIAAIAHIGGYNLKDDKVKTMIYACMLGSSGKELIKNTGIQVGKKLATNAIKNISGKTLTKINQKVGFRLITKFGEKGVINLGKTLPILGGVIGGTVDTITTNTIGNTARSIFIQEKQ